MDNGYASDETFLDMCLSHGYSPMRPEGLYENYGTLTLCEHPNIHVTTQLIMSPHVVRVSANELNDTKIGILRKLTGFKEIHNSKIVSDDGMKTNQFLIFEANISNFCDYESNAPLPPVFFPKERKWSPQRLREYRASRASRASQRRSGIMKHEGGAPSRHQSRKLRPKHRRRCTHRQKGGRRR